MSGHRWRHSWDDPFESGLVVVVPEAADPCAPVRDAFDPYAKIGVPAHITVLYPFVRPEVLSAGVIDAVRDVAERFEPFGFELADLRSFDDDVFYLAPTPAEPFVAITQALWDRFPDHPPFGGRFDTIVPHLSIAGAPFGATTEAVEELIAGHLPIHATATGVTLLVEDEDGWTAREHLPFGRDPIDASHRRKPTIDVVDADETGRRFTVTIAADDGSPSTHQVGVSDADWDRFGGAAATRAELVEASFRFLLEREPAASILRSFELGDIARYFPEYGEMFTGRPSASPGIVEREPKS